MIKACNIREQISKGGQKTVYFAEHPDVGNVVVKRGEIKSSTSLERIRREVDLLSSLKSYYYPQQHYFNIDIKNKSFEIVEEHIEGGMLRDKMAQFSTPKEIFSLLFELVQGLKIIWNKNIVHRDLKPENIIIRPNGKPCIIDLGIARFLDFEALTQTISPIGPCTPLYASPEQLENKKSIIDHRTDFYNLGIIALELYLEIHPFDPNYLKNHFSIIENIMQGIYLTSNGSKLENDGISGFAKKTLQYQPFNRFRTINLIENYILKYI